MCGLAGIAGHGIRSVHMEYFRDLLYISSLRGRDSTGVAGIRTKNSKKPYNIRRLATDSPEFVHYYSGSPGSFLHDTSYDIMMGHCRAATRGDITTANAHPFETSKLIGAHNGTLADVEFIDTSGKTTDSELMFQKMSRVGIEETLRDLSWRSAYAVSIYDKASKKLFLGRNIDRPLFVAFHEDEAVMSWASEQRMLEFTADRLHQKITVYRLLPNNLYVIDIDKIKRNIHNPWKVIEIVSDNVTSEMDWESYLSAKYGDRISYGYTPNPMDYVDGSYEEPVEQKTPIAELLDELEESVKNTESVNQ